jgi:protein-tyrosine phosphatase
MTPASSVLFVCLGNICRSPLARVVFTHLAAQRGVLDRLHVDSCGTGPWHVGKGADGRSIQVAARHQIKLAHTARQLDPTSDFLKFGWFIAMDRQNRDDLLHAGAPRGRVYLMRSFDPRLAGEPEHRLDVPDPYYGERDGFERVYDMLAASCDGLLHRVLSES